MNETIQYLIVGGILIASVIWIVVKFRRKQHGNDSVCCGCTLQDACKSKHKNQSCREKKTMH